MIVYHGIWKTKKVDMYNDGTNDVRENRSVWKNA